MKNAKPDFLDLDGDKNTDEPMKEAAEETKTEAQRFKDMKTKKVMDKMKKK